MGWARLFLQFDKCACKLALSQLYDLCGHSVQLMSFLASCFFKIRERETTLLAVKQAVVEVVTRATLARAAVVAAAQAVMVAEAAVQVPREAPGEVLHPRPKGRHPERGQETNDFLKNLRKS